jgi:hypothetical protein
VTIFGLGLSFEPASTFSPPPSSSSMLRAFRHADFDQHLGPIRCREELLL